MFCLTSPHVTRLERIGVLDVIDGLIRLKIDTGLLNEQAVVEKGVSRDAD